MSKPLIITISGRARHGKDTTGKIIKEILEGKGKRVLTIAYADYVKFTAKQYLGWDGAKDEKGRTLLQQHGTERVRAVDPNFWVDTVIRLVTVMRKDYDYVIVTDCRFPNEVYRWHEYKYETVSIHVTREGFESTLTKDQKLHPSEIAMDEFPFSTYVFAKSIDELKEKIVQDVIPLIERRVSSE